MKYLKEVMSLPTIGKEDKMDIKGLGDKPPKEATLLSTMPSGHKVYHQKVATDISVDNHYYATDKKGNVATRLVTSRPVNQKAEEIDKVASDSSNPDRPAAHELYHHLITKHDKMFMSNVQSPGGKRIWQKLSGMKNVNVHGWDAEKEKPHNIDLKSGDYDHEAYSSHSEIMKARESGGGVKNKEYVGRREAADMYVVAHRKSKPAKAFESKIFVGFNEFIHESADKKFCCSPCQKKKLKKQK